MPAEPAEHVQLISHVIGGIRQFLATQAKTEYPVDPSGNCTRVDAHWCQSDTAICQNPASTRKIRPPVSLQIPRRHIEGAKEPLPLPFESVLYLDALREAVEGAPYPAPASVGAQNDPHPGMVGATIGHQRLQHGGQFRMKGRLSPKQADPPPFNAHAAALV
jgi:hypothetical protein